MAGSLNISEVGVDPLYDENDIQYEERSNLYSVITTFGMVTDTIKFFLCLCVVAADIFLITIICKNKKLKTKTNGYIVQYAIFNIISIVFMPVFRILIEVTRSHRHLNSRVYCVVEQVESSSDLFSHLFAFGIALEWFYMVFNSALGTKLKNFHKYSVHIIYLVGSLKFFISIGECTTDHWIIRHIVEKVVFIGICIFLGICQYFSHTRTFSAETSNYALTISKVMVLSWVPLYLYHEFFTYYMGNETFFLIIYSTMFIPEWLAYGSPIVIIIILGNLNKYFRKAYDRAFKRSVQNYGDDADDLDESEENITGENNLNSYHNATIL